MSWREQSTFCPQQAPGLSESEKEFIKLAKKLKQIVRLEESVKEGGELQANQKEKVAGKVGLLDELGTCARQLPATSNLWERNEDVTKMLPDDVHTTVMKNREKAVKAKAASAKRQSGAFNRSGDDRDREVRRREPEVEAMPRHERPVVDVCAGVFDHFFTCSSDKLVIRWRVEDDTAYLKATCTYGGHEGAVWGVALVGGMVLSGGASEDILVFDPNVTTKVAYPVARIPVKRGIVRHIVPHPEISHIFATHQDTMGPPNITVWDLNKKEPIYIINDLPSKVKSLQWGMVGKGMKLFSGHDDGTVSAWDGETGAKIQSYRPHGGAVVDVKFYSKLHEGVEDTIPVLLTASLDGTAKILDLSVPSMRVHRTFTQNRPLRSIALIENHIVLAGGHDPMQVTTSKLQKDEFHVFVYTLEGEIVGVPGPLNGGHFGPIHQLKQLPGRPQVVSVSEDGGVKLTNVPDGTLIAADIIGSIRV
jgi:WD40 repeat protein